MPRQIINTRGPGYRKAIIRRTAIAVIAVLVVGFLAFWYEQRAGFGNHPGAAHSVGAPAPAH